MAFDLLALALLALFVFLGSRRGAIAAGSGLAALIAGYAGALLAAAHLGRWTSQQLEVAEIFGAPIAGSLGFLLAFAACSLVGALLRRIDRQRLGELPRSGGDRALGGLFGGLRGGLVVVLLSLLALWVDAARQFEVSPSFASLPALGNSRAAKLSGAAMGSATRSALADSGPMAGVAGRLVANPAETLARLQGLLEHEGFQELQADHMFWRYIQHGAVDNALNRSSFYHFSQDDALREELASLALINREEAADPAAFRTAIGDAIRAAGPRLEALNKGESLEHIAKDPEIVELIQNGDTLALINHPKIRDLAERVMTAEL